MSERMQRGYQQRERGVFGWCHSGLWVGDGCSSRHCGQAEACWAHCSLSGMLRCLTAQRGVTEGRSVLHGIRLQSCTCWCCKYLYGEQHCWSHRARPRGRAPGCGMLCALLALRGAGRDSGCMCLGWGCVWFSDNCAGTGASIPAGWQGFSWILEMMEASFLDPNVGVLGPGLLFLPRGLSPCSEPTELCLGSGWGTGWELQASASPAGSCEQCAFKTSRRAIVSPSLLLIVACFSAMLSSHIRSLWERGSSAEALWLSAVCAGRTVCACPRCGRLRLMDNGAVCWGQEPWVPQWRWHCRVPHLLTLSLAVASDVLAPLGAVCSAGAGAMQWELCGACQGMLWASVGLLGSQSDCN